MARGVIAWSAGGPDGHGRPGKGIEEMKWPWSRVKRQAPRLFVRDIKPIVPPQSGVQTLISIADRFRDQRLWEQAAQSYEAALAHDPTRAPIWIQFGHACKEAGKMLAAEMAYRRALEIKPDDADCYLQLGHVLKLQGQRPAALSAYAQALQVDRGFTAALTELIALGEGPLAGQVSGLGEPMLHELLGMVQSIRQTLKLIEDRLPDVASLASISVGSYDMFRRQYRLPAPPLVKIVRKWAVLVIGQADDIAPLIESLSRQTQMPARVIMRGGQDVGQKFARHCAYHMLQCETLVLHGDDDHFNDALLGIDWVVVADGRTALVPLAMAWLDWAAELVGNGVIYADEERKTTGSPVAGSGWLPDFKAAYDRHAPDAYRHGFVAVRADLMPRRLEGDMDLVSDRLVVAAFGGPGIGHLPRVLAQRGGNRAEPRPLARTMPDSAPAERICAIIPTRDGTAMLRQAVSALRRMAAQPAALEIIVVDNGSTAPDMAVLLAKLVNDNAVRVLRADTAFNWSSLNNLAAATTDAEILLFVNDDVEITRVDWDDLVRRDLADPRVGAVGIRLNYPNGALQHAGLVFGPNGRCEHEGVGTAVVLADTALRWRTRRSVGAVTGAFLACRGALHADLGGFDIDFPVWFNDVDFCLRLRAVNLEILYDPELTACHYESYTIAIDGQTEERRSLWRGSLHEMKRRWGAAMWSDPGFNPHFSRTGRPFEALLDPSITAIQDHFLLTAKPNPWLPTRGDTAC